MDQKVFTNCIYIYFPPITSTGRDGNNSGRPTRDNDLVYDRPD